MRLMFSIPLGVIEGGLYVTCAAAGLTWGAIRSVGGALRGTSSGSTTSSSSSGGSKTDDEMMDGDDQQGTSSRSTAASSRWGGD